MALYSPVMSDTSVSDPPTSNRRPLTGREEHPEHTRAVNSCVPAKPLQNPALRGTPDP